MAIRDILVHVEPGAASERRLACALALAHSFEARLTGISVIMSPTAMAFGMMGEASVYQAAAEAAEDSCAAAHEVFRKATANSTVATEWLQAEGIPLEVIAAEAGRADLVILGRDDDRGLDGGFYPLPPADLILAAGRPVLVLPDPLPEPFDPSRILLAWKSAPAATRALHDAMPFLMRAEAVVLTQIVAANPSGGYEVELDAVAAHLVRHGVKATTARVDEAGDLGDQLIRLAEEKDCSLIVAGGYGHSRFREWVLGGVTLSLLHDGQVPCILSH